MAYGMTYEQFWYGEPKMAETFREYYILKRKQMNEKLWLQGLYNTIAFGTVISNAFSKTKQGEYPKQPLDIFPKTKAEKEEEIINERRKLVDKLNKLKASFDSKNKK